jgi:hypothetical protein
MTHLSHDQLLARLYGLEPESANAHLNQCPECAARLAAMESRRAGENEIEIPAEFLAAQRRTVYERMEQRAPSHVVWAPALAAASLLAIGLLLYPAYHSTAQPAAKRPAEARVVPAAHPEMTDDQLLSDVFSMEQVAEPRAAAPIRALFEGRLSEDQIPEQQ